MGFPDKSTQDAYDETHKRALARRDKFYQTSFVRPVDASKLTEKGRADRASVAAANREVSQLDAILGRLNQDIRVSHRQQVLPFEVAKIVVTTAFEKEMARKKKRVYFTDEQLAIVDDITKYFIGDPSGPYSLVKGLFVYGGLGVGKTMLFRVMQTVCRVTPILEMQFEEVATKTLYERYVTYKESKEKKNNPLAQYSRGHLLLNDLGEERQTHISYTNEERPMDLLLSERNEAWDRFGHLTHVTTNLGLGDSETALEDQLNKVYGSRILDRFHDMFEIILLPGESKRG